jgi:hypothetical protein
MISKVRFDGRVALARGNLNDALKSANVFKLGENVILIYARTVCQGKSSRLAATSR